MLDNGKPQSCAAGASGAPLIDAVKALGKPRNVLFLNADARILHGEHSTARCAEPPHINAAAFRRITHGIGNGLLRSKRIYRMRRQPRSYKGYQDNQFILPATLCQSYLESLFGKSILRSRIKFLRTIKHLRYEKD